jgi:hypothetical protein
MPEILFTPFLEEEGFTEASITDRLDQAKAGLNSVVQQASERGALNENHGGSCVVFMDTIEQTTPSLHQATWGNLWEPVYWNLTNGNGSGDGRQLPPPADGSWEAIGGAPLEINFTPIPLLAATPDDRFGVSCIYVMLNAEVRYVNGVDHQGTVKNVDCGVAITVQWEGFKDDPIPSSQGWFHIYQNMAPADAAFVPPGLVNWCRLPERKVGPAALQLVPGGLNNQLDIWHDISIRTTIRPEDLMRAANELPVGPLPIDLVGAVRGSISLITTDLVETTRTEIRNANLTVIALRGTEALL